MAIGLRKDEEMWRRYDSDETTAAMRAAEAWCLRIGGAFMMRHTDGMSGDEKDMAMTLGSKLIAISDARMEYLASPKYDTSFEETVSSNAFDVLSRFYNDPASVHPSVLSKSLDLLLAAFTYSEDVTRRAGFLHPTRLESGLTRGDK